MHLKLNEKNKDVSSFTTSQERGEIIPENANCAQPAESLLHFGSKVHKCYLLLISDDLKISHLVSQDITIRS